VSLKTSWLIWKPVFAQIATLKEIKESWTLSDLIDCNEILIVKEDTERRELEKIKRES
jgi:hypothetical protein